MIGMDSSIYSDVHKDAYGFRPFGVDVFASIADFDETVEQLVSYANESYLMEKEDQSIRYEKWIRNVHAQARMLGAKVADVIRWQFEADDMNINKSQDRDMFCFSNGLSYDAANLIAKTQR